MLRPWGLGSSAPLTESPAMPDLAAAYVLARDGPVVRGRRLPWMLIGGIGVLAVAGMLAYPYAQADEPRSVSTAPLVPIDPPQPSRVAAETKLMAPALIEPVLGAVSRKAAPSKPVAAAVGPGDALPRIASAPRDLAVAVAYPISLRDVVVGDGRGVNAGVEAPATAPVAAAEPPDRWQTLANALAACGTESGVFARTMCEQRARIAGCDSHWGEVALCPQSRTDERR